MKKYKLAILASGSGTNAENLIKYFEHHPEIQIGLVGSNRTHAFVLERVRPYNIPTYLFNSAQLMAGEVTSKLLEHGITHVVLAGFLALIPANMISVFPDRIVNIHPSLLPAFGGKGMYGMKVAEAVIAAGVDESGITIHLVNEQYDEGRILFQARVKVQPKDTAESLMSRIHELEYTHYPQVIESWVLSTE